MSSVSYPRNTRKRRTSSSKRLPEQAKKRLTSSRESSFLKSLQDNLLFQILVAFVLVFSLKWPVLHDPPVWDTAMSVFPAAITLVEYDFDFLRLLEEPSYLDAGPNVHADSLVTLITALVIWTAGETEVFLPALHLFHFLITSLTLVAIYRHARPILGNTVASLSVLAAFTFPVFLTQAGYMYLEMPLAFGAIMAFLAFRNRRIYQAALWAMVSWSIKPTGIFVGGALTAAALLATGAIRERLKRAVIIGGPPLTFALAKVAFLSASPETKGQAVVNPLSCFELEFSRYLMGVPDLAILVGLFLIACGVLHRRIWTGLRRADQTVRVADQNQWIALNFLGVLFFLLVIHLVAPIVLDRCFGLPRYYVPVLPFIFITLSLLLITLMSRHKTALVLLLAIGFFIANRNGIFYPSDVDQHGLFGNNFALTERSGAYRGLARIQRQAMQFLEKIPADVPVYFGLHEGYLNRYPAMGYVSRTMANAESITRWDGKQMKQLLSHPPRCIYFLYNYPWLGGERIQFLVSRLKPTHRSETVRIFRSGENKIIVHRMRMAGSNCGENLR